ncbi:MAG: zinc dependent phospholipase C family protein [Oscillospiraceae bacterium]|nr:zinc dependent phospholipase C family protein [Oscillospiraceae bacterium]
MPAAYAHYTFGKKVFKELPQPVRALIGRSALHKKLFAIGLQGPDILFFYHPWCKNRVNTLGNEIHRQPAADFLDSARSRLGDPPDEALLCYLLGFVCHFTLDSQCHPYIARRMTQTSVTHHQIESEFDRMLMEEDDRNPMTFNPAAYASPDPEACCVIAGAYEDISAHQVSDALKGMILVRDILTGRTAPKRMVVGGLTGLTPLKGLALPQTPNPRCLASNRELHWLYDSAVREGAALVLEFYQLAYNGASLPQRFLRNFE